MRPKAVLLAVALAATLLPASPAAAKTIATFDGTVVTLYVPVDIIGMDDYRWQNPDTGRFTDIASEAATRFQEQANALWNEQLADLLYLDCFTFRVEIELFPLPSGHPGNEGHHRIVLNKDPTFRSNVVFPSGALETGDSSSLYLGSGGGEWSSTDLMDRWVLAHEAGHLLGLDDDYTDVGGTYRDVKGVPKPGREGTIMEGGSVVDQDVVDRLGELVDDVEDLPECWRGTIDSDTSRDYRDAVDGREFGTCSDGWRTELTFTVHDGFVKGSATTELVSGPECTFAAILHEPWTTGTLGVLGTATDEEFRLEFEGEPVDVEQGVSYGGITTLFLEGHCPVPTSPGPSITVPRTGEGEARAEVDLSGRLACAGSANDDFSSSNTVEIQQVTL